MANIGRYEILRALTSGGMADVYLARDPNTDRQVVIKVIKSDYSDNLDFRQRFKREARIIAALEHPAIVPVHDFDEYQGQLFIVMRYMPGGSLLDRQLQGPLSLSEVSRIVSRIADALEVAHNHGIVHRDLKPGNILFDANGHAYLSDFGIAKQTADSATHQPTTGFIGTPAYASPEQVEAKTDLDRRSDVYSLGVIIYELLSGQLPYNADTPMGLALAHLRDPIPDILAISPGLPPECETLVTLALAKDRTERYATTTALAEALNHITQSGQSARQTGGDTSKALTNPPAQGLPPEKRYEGPPLPEQRRPSRFPALALGGGLVISLLVACVVLTLVGGLFILPRLQPKPTATPVALEIATSTPSASIATDVILPSPLPSTATEPVTAEGPSLTLGETKLSEKDGMTLLAVPAGDFLMGSTDSDAQAFNPEKPQHTVFLAPFWIDQTDVSNSQYAKCVQAGECLAPAITGSQTHSAQNGYYGNPKFDNYPVIEVTWSQASAYCTWAGRRLPSEAEWEKAARGTDGRLYPWGNDLPSATLLNANKVLGDTSELGHYPQNVSPYGALDMAGNVWQWVNDWFDPAYYPASDANNPIGPASGKMRVLRGGSWTDPYVYVRAAARGADDPSGAHNNYGFRCALSP